MEYFHIQMDAQLMYSFIISWLLLLFLLFSKLILYVQLCFSLASLIIYLFML